MKKIKQLLKNIKWLMTNDIKKVGKIQTTIITKKKISPYASVTSYEYE